MSSAAVVGGSVHGDPFGGQAEVVLRFVFEHGGYRLQSPSARTLNFGQYFENLCETMRYYNCTSISSCRISIFQ